MPNGDTTGTTASRDSFIADSHERSYRKHLDTMITVADNAGFCFGVKRAVSLVDDALNGNDRLFMLGELIHNKDFSDRLIARGAQIITPDDIYGLDPEKVYKTIVMISSSNQIYVFVTPALFTISLKKAKDLTGEKSLELLKLDLLRKYTGYIRGGCSPLGMIRKYPTYIEELAQLEDYIYVSAGVRGLQLRLKPEDLAAACEGEFASFT